MHMEKILDEVLVRSAIGNTSMHMEKIIVRVFDLQHQRKHLHAHGEN